MAIWNNFLGDEWNFALNWDTGVPNGVDTVATFGLFQPSAGLSDIINLTGNTFTVGTLGLTSTAGDQYVLENGTLIMQVSSGSAGIAISTSGAGPALPNIINTNATLQLNSATTIDTTADAELWAFGVISGTGALTKTGAGRLSLHNSNTFTGATAITAGTLLVAGENALATSSGVTLSAGAQLRLSNDDPLNNNVNITNLAGSGGTVSSGGSASQSLTLTEGNGVFEGVLQDGSTGLSLVKNGSGNTYLAGANTYSGGTTVNDGILLMGGSGPTGTIGTGAVAINGGTFALFRSDDLTFANTIAGTANFDKNLANTATLTGDNSGFTGTFTVNGGTLTKGSDFASDFAFGNGGAAMVVNAGATVDTVFFPAIFRALSGAGTVTASGNKNSRLIISGTTNSTFDGVIQNGSASSLDLHIGGAGTLTLTGVNTYTGGTRILGGQLSLMGTGTVSGGVVLVALGGTFNIAGTSAGTSITGLSEGGGGGSVILGGKSLSITAQGIGSITAVNFVGSTSGVDALSIALATNLWNFRIDGATFTDWTAGTDTITLTGNALNNALTGSNQDDQINGGIGYDTLTGGLGIDTLIGGAGNDHYIVADAGDVVTEVAGEGTDSVTTEVSLTLATGSSIESMTALEGATALNLTGNEFNQSLVGNAGSNILNGGSGLDTMSGGLGNDWYYVDNLGDVPLEAVSGGTDRLTTSITFALRAGSEIERMDAATGVAAINLTGNEFGQSLVGNDGANTLNGQAGADTMSGGLGNDIYIVDSLSDVVLENVGGGVDRISASLTFSLRAGQEIERLDAAVGTAAINLYGNELVQSLNGNAGANVLDGRAGADVMTGFGGNDIYFVDNIGDVVNEATGGGVDRLIASFNFVLRAASDIERLDAATGTTAIDLTGNELGQALNGNAGANVLNGALGNDVLTGGAGLDTFVFNRALNAATNVDTVTDFSVADDAIAIENGIMTALGATTGVLDATMFVIGTTAADASDRIVYNSATGFVSYDADGSGGIAQVAFARLTAGLAVTNADFLVI